jgi:tetratricopeptide (TPR) repeat protein
MVPKTLPPLSIALTLLRTGVGWDQKDLAVAAGTSPGVISDYERAFRRKLSREKLEDLVGIMGLPPEAIDRALHFLAWLHSAAQAPEPGGESFESQRRQIEAIAAGTTQMVTEVLTRITLGGRATLARDQARGLWERLKRRPAGQRRAVVEEALEFRSWALCELVCAESVEAAADDADRSMELAELALLIATLGLGEQSWRWRLQGYAWAHLGNARRVKGDLPGADQAFLESDRLWEAGAPGDPGLLNGARRLGQKATLRRYQGHFTEALALLDQGLAEGAGDVTAKLLINKANTLELAGDYLTAIEVLQRMEPLLKEERGPRPLWLHQFSLASNLCHAGRPAEAQELLPGLRVLALQLGNGLDSLRLRWLEGRIAAGMGRREEALEALSQVRVELVAKGIAYDAALATLQMAALYLEQGRTGEVKALARQMAPIFKAQGVHQEALAALKLFCQAAEREAATPEMIYRMIQYLCRARHNSYLRFEIQA